MTLELRFVTNIRQLFILKSGFEILKDAFLNLGGAWASYQGLPRKFYEASLSPHLVWGTVKSYFRRENKAHVIYKAISYRSKKLIQEPNQRVSGNTSSKGKELTFHNGSSNNP